MSSPLPSRNLVFAGLKVRAVSFQALEQIAWMCGDHEKSQEIGTPRYLKVKTHSKIMLLRNRGGKESKEDLFLVMIVYLVFLLLTDR